MRSNVVAVVVVVFNPFPLVNPFVRTFLTFESPSVGTHVVIGSHGISETTLLPWVGWENFHNIRWERFQNVGAVTKQCMVLVIIY